MNTFDSTTDSSMNQIQDVDMSELNDQSSNEGSYVDESDLDELDLEESDFEGSEFEYSDDSDSDYPSDFEEDPEEIARSERVQREIEEKEKRLAELTKQVEEMKKFVEMMNYIEKGSDKANKMKNNINNILQQQSRK